VSTKIIYNLIEQQIETDQVVPLAALRRGDLEIVEVEVSAESPVVGEKVGRLDLPADTLIISVVRGDHAMIPNLDTRLEPGDGVIALVKAQRESDIREAFGGAPIRS
jgi:trk system potassium uptake protein TrkA